jgi:hypothetical protein
MEKERIFADGFVIKRRDNAPEFVIANISVKVDEAIAFLRKHEKNGWVNLNAKTGRSGNPYIELDTFDPKKKAEPKAEPAAAEPEVDGDLPF